MSQYYPIKCPYCLKSHTNDTVYFSLKHAIVKSSKAVKGSVGKSGASEEEEYISSDNSGSKWNPDSGESAWDAEGSDEQPKLSAGHSENKRLPAEGYYTLPELVEICGMRNIPLKANKKSVNALPSLTDEACGGDMVTSVELTVIEDDKEVVKIINDRYCDCDDYGHKLLMSSGSVPSYVVLLMGSSQAGKTVYLVSLYHSLARKGGFSLPPTKDPNNAIANISLTVLSDCSADTDIANMEESLFEYGQLPDTTRFMQNEPLIMDITVKLIKSGLANKALLFLRDIPGENLTKRDMQHEIVKITDQFPKFDGFILMFDPLTFEESVFPSHNSERDREQRKQIDRLKAVIARQIAPSMENNMISQPAVTIVTKADKFNDRKYSKALMNKGISFSNPVLSALLASATRETLDSFDKLYFDEIDLGTKKIINTLSENISSLTNAYFNNVFYTMISALSNIPIEIDEENNKVLSPTAISPWRVTDPTLRLLMKLKILPPFDETVMRPGPAETEDERAARRFKNRSIINGWGEKYCSGISNQKLV